MPDPHLDHHPRGAPGGHHPAGPPGAGPPSRALGPGPPSSPPRSAPPGGVWAGHPAAPPLRPLTVTIAAALMWLAGALGLGVGVLALATDDLLVRELLPRFLFGHPPHGTGIRIVELTLYLAAMAVVLTLALLAVTAYQGSNASRWVLVGLLGFWSLPSVLAGAVHPHPVSLLLGFGPAVVILLFLLPPASAWYRHQTSRRRWRRHLIEIQRHPGRRTGPAPPGRPARPGHPASPGR